jgi:hypothetical protein
MPKLAAADSVWISLKLFVAHKAWLVLRDGMLVALLCLWLAGWRFRAL